MERLDGGSVMLPHLRGGIVALGNFDGFHIGHQAVVGRAIARARAEGRPALVATFDPHPVRVFRPDTPPFRLTTLDQRARLFAQAGADAMLVFHFDREMAALSPRAYAERYLDGLSGVVTGSDFTFGRQREGTPGVLQTLGAELGFTAEAVAPVSAEGAPVSSSRIRAALQSGHPRDAAALLTRPFAIEGVVEPGAQLGRQLGYPTANLTLGTYLRPSYGVYAVRGRLPDGRMLDGVASLGIRPMIEPPIELLEPYFFDFSGDLYGQKIEVELIEYLRPEVKFDGLEPLKAQIAQDCLDARATLAR